MKRVKCKCGTAYNATRVCCPSCGEDRPVKFFEQPVLEIPDVEQPARVFAERRGWLFEKVQSASRRGWPDRFLARAGEIRLVEFKKPGEEPSEQQLKRHRDLAAKGIKVWVYDNLEAFKADFY
jgi:hypothetical protein